MQIHHIVQKANQLIGLIKKSFEVLDATLLQTLHTNLVHASLFGLCHCGLVPFPIGRHIRAIERYKGMQIRLFHHLIKDKSYYDHLVPLNLPTLFLYKWRRMDMIMVCLTIFKSKLDEFVLVGFMCQILHIDS